MKIIIKTIIKSIITLKIYNRMLCTVEIINTCTASYTEKTIHIISVVFLQACGQISEKTTVTDTTAFHQMNQYAQNLFLRRSKRFVLRSISD